jgi:plastocyanin
MTTQQRTSHATTQTVGLATITATFLALMVVSLVLLDGDEIGVFIVFAALVGAATLVTWRFDRQWARAIGLAGTVVSLGGFFFAFGLFHVFSPIEFIAAVAYVIGVVVSLVGGIRAILASRKGRQGATRVEQRLPVVVAGIIGVAAVVSITGFLLTRQDVSDSDAAGAELIEMTKFAFDPDPSEVPADATLLVRNSDPFVHDITIEALDVSVTVGPGSEALVDLGEAAPGTYEYFCSLHWDGTSGMSGTLVIDG